MDPLERDHDLHPLDAEMFAVDFTNHESDAVDSSSSWTESPLAALRQQTLISMVFDIAGLEFDSFTVIPTFDEAEETAGVATANVDASNTSASEQVIRLMALL